MTDPTEDIPPDRPLGQRDRDLEFGALGLGMAGAGGIGAVIEFAYQFHWPLKGVNPPVPVVADIHQPPADRTIAVEDVKFPEGEIGILGPSVGHPTNLHAWGKCH